MKTVIKIFYIIPCLLMFIQPVPAPVPRCSPLIIINKLAESSNLLSDSNPYFPVPPCEYGSFWEALKYKDYRSIFVLAEPEKILRHNFYEFVWLLKTGGPRWIRMLLGKEPFIYDNNILKEGYYHYTPYVRTRKIGLKTHRTPRIIDDKYEYDHVISNMLKELKVYGPDKADKHSISGYNHHHYGSPQSEVDHHYPERYHGHIGDYKKRRQDGYSNIGAAAPPPANNRQYESGFKPSAYGRQNNNYHSAAGSLPPKTLLKRIMKPIEDTISNAKSTKLYKNIFGRR